MLISLTDAEQAFASSGAGRVEIARARMKYEMGQAHRGAGACPWTDAMELAAVRQLTVRDARNRVSGAAMIADAERQVPALEAAAAAARQKMITNMNSWRESR